MATPTHVTQFGRYLLLKKLATGGMAELYLGKQVGIEGFEKPVVIKQILPHLSENEEFITMFLDEARVAARLNHPRVVQIYDLGREGESYFIAMEYVRGQDLRKIIKRAQTLREGVPLGISLQILVGVLEGLDHAHRKTDDAGRPIHVVHRDVSPQNILVSYEGDVKIVDFGIAKASTQIYQTRAGILKGKYAYMSPEQAQGLPVDRRSDIFAVGILLYELTTGRRLFRQANEIDTLKKVIECNVQPPSAVEPDYPADLEEIVMRALRREPAERFQQAREMQVALEGFLRRHAMLTSSNRLAEYMHRIFGQEIQAALDEIRVLMEARPGATVASLPADAAAGDEHATHVPSGSGRSADVREPAAAEKTLLLEEHEAVPLEGGTRPAEADPGETLILDTAAAPETTATQTTDVGRRRRLTLLSVTVAAIAIAALVVLWRVARDPYPFGKPAAPEPPPPTAAATPTRPAEPAPAPVPVPTVTRPSALAPAVTPAPARVEEEDEEEVKPVRRRRAPKKKRKPVVAAGPATLAVRTTPKTQVYAGGKFLGTTPFEMQHEPGTVSLRFRSAAHAIDYRTSAKLRAGARAEVQKTFGRARIKVSVEPWAEVTLDGRKLGETPLAPQSVYEGDHVLTLVNPRLGKSETVRVRVKAGQTELVERIW